MKLWPKLPQTCTLHEHNFEGATVELWPKLPQTYALHEHNFEGATVKLLPKLHCTATARGSVEPARDVRWSPGAGTLSLPQWQQLPVCMSIIQHQHPLCTSIIQHPLSAQTRCSVLRCCHASESVEPSQSQNETSVCPEPAFWRNYTDLHAGKYSLREQPSSWKEPAFWKYVLSNG